MKKGSAAAIAWGKKMKAARKKSNSKRSQKGGVKMVKRKIKRRKSVKAKSSKRRKPTQSEKIDMLLDVGFPAVYGYGREKLSTAIEPATNRIPLGLISDELVLGLGAFFGNKYLKNKKVKKACKNVLIIESSRVGETTSDFGFKKTFTGK